MSDKPKKHYELPMRQKDDDTPMSNQDVIGILFFILMLVLAVLKFT